MLNSGKKPIILVVEDDEFSRYFIQEALENRAQVVIAKSGEEALHKLKDPTQLPDLVVVDIVLNALNGIELTRHIRFNLSEQQIPVFVLSSHVDQPMEKIAYRAGATMVCSKGLSADDLLQRIQALLDVTFNPVA